jgi:hypothetical protein
MKAINASGKLIEVAKTNDPAANARGQQRRLDLAKADLVRRAQAALDATDHWAMADYDKPFTDERKAYRAALRGIVRAPDLGQPLPAKPA